MKRNFSNYCLHHQNPNFSWKFIMRSSLTQAYSDVYTQRRIQRRRPPPPFKIFYGCIFGNFDSMTHRNLIVINIIRFQYVLYSLLALQKPRIRVKGHQNNLQTSKTIPRRDRAPRFLNFWIRHWHQLVFHIGASTLYVHPQCWTIPLSRLWRIKFTNLRTVTSKYKSPFLMFSKCPFIQSAFEILHGSL